MAASETKTDLSNWRTHPCSEYGFANIDKLLSTQTIKKASQPSPSFEKSSRNLDNFALKTKDGKTLNITDFLVDSHTDGFLVLHNGKRVHGFYAHGNNEKTKHIMMSMTKSVVGLVTGVLVEQGLIDPAEKVTTYLSELRETSFKEISVRHLLDMRAGIQYDDSSYEYSVSFGYTPLRAGDKATNFNDFLKIFNPPTISPGGAFTYSSVNTDVLSLVLERVSGKKLAELISEHIWEPIGAESDALIAIDSAGNPRGAGGMCATIHDLARLGQALLSDSLVSKAWLDDILNGGDAEVFAAGSFAPLVAAFGDAKFAYRDCFTVSGDLGIMVAVGIHGQTLIVDRKAGIVLAKTSSQPDPIMKLSSAVQGFLEIKRVLTENS
ncbi:hypothetical protein B0A48_08751 [Cryoendolithus antarcticus]|uniref:Beta-lactamase-related domain-containing protein n=1 Tax=Cryoendolithus antarcticus TaxID=1507870 RepID=A0A1V8T425_9PEZI|nr:hypothetical protein B0A48_08751 [Cryoendolithus antarcticus]